ncbi:hypothetical protein H4R35_002580 [Dimargaris xerosporica]|nr:hypothetical protein H4R35_002580 [Dimargaris xerosporica]
MASGTSRRTVIIALNPKAQEAAHTIAWAIDNFLDPKRDTVKVVSGICLQADLDAVAMGVAAIDTAAYFVDLEEEDENEVTQMLVQQSRALKDADIDHECIVVKGHSDVRDLVVNYINRQKADALLVGSRDLGTWKRDFCVHSVHCPVIVVKQPVDAAS